MAKLGDELEKQAEEAALYFHDKLKDLSALSDYGCITVVQSTIIAILTLVRGRVEEKHFEAAGHYMKLAQLDILDGRLNPKHPLTHIPWSEYLRMARAGIIQTEADIGIPIPISHWLITLDEAERWLQSKGLHVNFDELREKAVGARREFEPTPAPIVDTGQTPASSVYDWQSQARLIADECFDADTRGTCRDSLKGYSNRVMEEMQKRGIKGPRGFIDNPNTVMREALQGEKWWGNKQK